MPCAQHGVAREALRLHNAALADANAACEWTSTQLAHAHAALQARLVEQARERAATDQLRGQLADARAWLQAYRGALVRLLTCWGVYILTHEQECTSTDQGT